MVESVMPFVRRIIKYVFVLTLKLRERTFNKRIKYLFFNRHSSVLAVVFSGMDTFDNKRLYNYVRGLSNVPVDFLYLSDPFGFRGSYYWKENGGDEPFRQTQSLINKVIDRGGVSMRMFFRLIERWLCCYYSWCVDRRQLHSRCIKPV